MAPQPSNKLEADFPLIIYFFHIRDPVCFAPSTIVLTSHLVQDGELRDSSRCLTIEAETVLDGSVGGRRRRRERQGEGLQGGPHNTHKEGPRLRPSYVVWRKDRMEGREQGVEEGKETRRGSERDGTRGCRDRPGDGGKEGVLQNQQNQKPWSCLDYRFVHTYRSAR